MTVARHRSPCLFTPAGPLGRGHLCQVRFQLKPVHGRGLPHGCHNTHHPLLTCVGRSVWLHTIHKVVVNVSGDPWVDREKEFQAAFARD
jgi:hypothetical protein